MAKCGTACQAIAGGAYGLASAYAYQPGTTEETDIKNIVLFPGIIGYKIAQKLAENQGKTTVDVRVHYIASVAIGVATTMLLGSLLRG